MISKGSFPLGQPLSTNREMREFKAFNIFPNPSTGKFNIGLETHLERVDIVIYDQTGRSIEKIVRNYPGDRIEMDLTGVSQGIYLVTVTTKEAAGTKLLVVE